jgi:Flp pilus assembly protein TadD
MPKLPPPDHHHVRAAEGWLELGNPTEAGEELQRVSAAQRDSAEVLEAWWRVHAATKDWNTALGIGERLVSLAPARASSWINLAFSLHELGRTREAWDKLLPAAKQFPTESTVPYNLACYACQLGELDAAQRWLAKAIKLGGKSLIKQRALEDTDLKPLWEEIAKL